MTGHARRGLRCGIRTTPPLLAVLTLAGCPAPEAACDLGVEAGPGVEALWVPVNPFAGDARRLGSTPVHLTGSDRPISVDVDGDGLQLVDADGAPVGTHTDLEGPATVHVEGLSAGSARLVFRSEECPEVAVDVTVVAPAPLVGRPRDEDPGFGFDAAFVDGETAHLAVDPTRRPDLVDREASAWVVPHRSAEAWAADPTLTGASVTDVLAPGGGFAGTHPWTVEVPDEGLGAAWDVIVDLDGDGTFSPGDLWDLADVPTTGLWGVGDFGRAGPHPTDTRDVSGGDWLGERLYWPTDAVEPRPLVVISHGNGHDYTWYDYLGEHLASWGYVVMAHQNETNPGIETASETTLRNTDWLLANLEQVADGALAGRVDATRLAWIGHSRGGEGIVRAYARVVEGEYTPSGWDAAAVRVLASIAPTVFYEVQYSDPHDVRYHLLAGSSDGDVTGGPDSPYTQYWRLVAAAQGVVSTTYVYGASHEDFNCCGYDDGAGPDQLSRSDTQDIARAWLLAVVADGVDADPWARLVLSRDPAHLPATATAATVLGTFHDPDALVIDDFQLNADPARASSGAAVTWSVDDYAEGRLDDADLLLEWDGKDPMNGMTQADLPSDDAAGAVFSWEAPGFVSWELPSEVADWSGRSALTLRVCQGTRHPLTVDWEAPVDLEVTVTDREGASVTRPFRPSGSAATPYLRGRLGEGKGWSNAFSTLRIPLVDFTIDGSTLDLSRIASVRLEVGGAEGTPAGRVGIDDLEVTP